MIIMDYLGIRTTLISVPNESNSGSNPTKRVYEKVEKSSQSRAD